MLDIRDIEHGYWWNAKDKYNLLVHKVVSLKEITIQVTDRCNMACPKCNKVNMTCEDMKTDDVIRIIDEAVELGLVHVHFTGGEPTMHPDFPDIVKHCRSLGLRVDMSSNGKFNREYAKKLNDAGISSINISWDYTSQIPQCLEDPRFLEAELFVNHMVMPANFQRLSGFLYFIKAMPKYDQIIDIQLMPPRGTADKFTAPQLDWFNSVIAPESWRIAQDRFPMVVAKVLGMLPPSSVDGIYHEPITWPCHRAKAELRVGVQGFSTCTYLYRDGKVTCGLDMSVKEAWQKCRAMARKAPPLKMCETSCSPEVANFNCFVEEGLKCSAQSVNKMSRSEERSLNSPLGNLGLNHMNETCAETVAQKC